MFPEGLLRFKNEQVLDEIGMKPYVVTGGVVPEAVKLKCIELPMPAFYTLGRDEEGSQISGDNILADVFRLTGEGRGDYHHRSWNDIKLFSLRANSRGRTSIRDQSP